MIYHFYCLKSSIVLHMKNVGNSSIRSTIQKPCRSGTCPLAPKNLKTNNPSCLNPTTTLLNKGRHIRGHCGELSSPCLSQTQV